MTERRANERRNWKAMLFPYDEFLPDATNECQYCLTFNQAMLLRGLLEPVGWATRWWSDDNEIDRDAIEAFRDDMIRRLMMPCCNNEFDVIFQWTEDGVLQKSEDNGTTWEDAPEEDPRNSSTTYPPVPGEPSDDKKCIAATGMTQIIKTQVGDQLTDDMSHLTLQQLIETWVTTIIQTSNPFQALINIAVNQIFALVIAALRPALTDAVYHQLTCIFFNNINDDLSFTEGTWAIVRSEIIDQISGIAGVFLEHLVFLLGKVGLTNLSRSQAATSGDCSDCEECCNDVRNFVPYDAEGGDINESVSTCNYLEVTAHIRGDGHYYVILVNTTEGIHFDGFADLDSSITGGTSAWTQPPEDPNDVVVPLHTGTIPHGELTTQTVNGILFRSDTPFRAGITSTPC